LAYTGAPVVEIAVLGVVALLSGLLLLVVTRRRAAAATPDRDDPGAE
jgi:LPXTG-motif cell wall-anchored protein